MGFFGKQHSFLGELESKVMEVVWKRRRATVREVLNEVRKDRSVAYTTVMTVMDRLFKKNILKRTFEKSGAYQYRAAMSRTDFFKMMARKTIATLLQRYGEIAVSEFVETLKQTDPKTIAQWKRKLKKIM